MPFSINPLYRPPERIEPPKDHVWVDASTFPGLSERFKNGIEHIRNYADGINQGRAHLALRAPERAAKDAYDTWGRTPQARADSAKAVFDQSDRGSLVYFALNSHGNWQITDHYGYANSKPILSDARAAEVTLRSLNAFHLAQGPQYPTPGTEEQRTFEVHEPAEPLKLTITYPNITPEQRDEILAALDDLEIDVDIKPTIVEDLPDKQPRRNR